MRHKPSFASGRLVAWIDAHVTLRGCVLLAGLFGLAQALDLFSLDFLLGRGLFWQAPPFDTADPLIAQRYFDAEPWGWPLTHVSGLREPIGISISNVPLPLAILLSKALQPVFGKDVNLFGLYDLIAMILQPISMLWLLWAIGVRSRISLLCGAVIALSFPVFLFRVGHIALFGQYPVTAALALYFTVRRRAEPWLWAGFVCLSLITMLIVLYLTVMVDAILAAAVLAEMLRMRRLRTPGAVALLVLIAASLGLLWAAEYLSVGGGTFPGKSYGYFSMNLLSPFVPQLSTVFGTEGQVLDATGGQYEGMAYLGAGLLLLLCMAIAALPVALLSGSGRDGVRLALRCHWPLLSALLALAAFAVSNEIYIGRYHVHVDLPVSADLLGDLRSCGRFFWPLGYALAAGLIWTADRALPGRRGSLLLVLAAALQFIDASALRAGVAAYPHAVRPATLPAEPWRRLVQAHESLVILPLYHCAAEPTQAAISDLLLYASEHVVPVNTMYTGRSPEDCVASARAGRDTVLGDGALHVFFDEQFSWGAIRDLAGANALCRKFPGGHVCTARWPKMADKEAMLGFTAPGGAKYAIGEEISFADPGAADFRGWGWWQAEGAGAWTVGDRSDLNLELADPPPASPLIFRFRGHVSLLGVAARRLTLAVDDTVLADWTLTDDADHDYAAALPIELSAARLSLRFDLSMDDGRSPRDLHLASDNRRLGFHMDGFSLDRADGAGPAR